MDFTTLISFADVPVYLKNSFGKNICDKIFGSKSDHLYEKWIETNTNIVSFLIKLDENNKIKKYSNGVY